MNTAQIQHQHIIHKDPYIVIAGELEGHGLIPLRAHVDHSARRLAEVKLQRHSQMVVPPKCSLCMIALNGFITV